ncbi:hypothetical protein KL907_004219 [Ogataea polymorpha]|nr:hypothetical protein KL937_003969 [Ogataea polymorpha]KAG7890258.1 hypothetical protein KL908_004596 [Ogataea polymorpha]KAG7901549.1 hypothetical protein KL907_004219 [Ogataea polymorpha]KAG7907044.1 hypothetical protein KL906_004230 [Ogataea polymorpha]
MKFSAAIFAAGAIAAYVPSEPWSTLTPSATLESATTDYTKTFGIAINKVTSTSGAKAKRDVVTQIGDGQVQATTATTAAVVSQIGDGQIQATTATAKTTSKTTAPVVSQIGDGQIQATTATPKTTSKTTAAVVSQIGDGQIQATTATPETAAVVTQIGDGQIQATTATSKAAETTANVVSQIGDGQIQATTATSAHKSVVSQIGDGQVQATTGTSSVASQITDGQVQASSTAAAGDSSSIPTSCKSDEALAMVLKDGILTDSKGRIGSIVANRQFQFDGPPPQAGAIYAAGWAISPEGYLAIGNTTTFYQCLSGNFYNLYDESIGGQCEPVHLNIVDLVSC